MNDFAALEQHLTSTLSLTRRPVAIAFRESPPADVAKLSGTQPSGCSFWRLAAAGQVFYTVPSDHYNCPVGSYTHNIAAPEGPRARVDEHPGADGQRRLSEDGRSPGHSATRGDAGGGDLRATRD